MNISVVLDGDVLNCNVLNCNVLNCNVNLASCFDNRITATVGLSLRTANPMAGNRRVSTKGYQTGERSTRYGKIG